MTTSPTSLKPTRRIILSASLLAVCFLAPYAVSSSAQDARKSAPAATEPAVTAPDISELEELAIRAAARHVAPSVIRIEILDATSTDASIASSSRASAIVIHEDGYIVASAASFTPNATTILAQLPDGKRVAAKRIATDKTRQIVLLKLESSAKLAVPETAPLAEVAVGHWAIAVGRMFDPVKPTTNQTTDSTTNPDPEKPNPAAEVNLSVGVVSALDRVWGKAIQTDAKISPNNYGGPLVDIRGRVIAIITPLPLDGAGGTEGGELYDSGIGFAVPWAHVVANFKKLSAGNDLKPGKLGIRLSSSDAHASDVTIGAISPGSPARSAGLALGDRIISIDGATITRPSELSRLIQPKYAGDRIKIVVERALRTTGGAKNLTKSERIERELELIAELPPYRRALLGVLPARDSSLPTVRAVWPNSPAAKAGIQPGDRMMKFGDKLLLTSAELVAQLADSAPGDRITIEYQRGEERKTAEMELADASEATSGRSDRSLPATLPMRDKIEATAPGDATANSETANPKAKQPLGIVPIKLPEFKNAVSTYIPPRFNGTVPLGMLVALIPQSVVTQPAPKDADQIAQWRELCDRHEFMLLIVRSTDPTSWSPAEADVIRRAVESVAARYPLDRSRLVLHGNDSAGTLALSLAVTQRKAIRGAIAIEAALPIGVEMPQSEPLEPLSVFLLRADTSRQAKRIDATATQLRKAQHSVTTKTIAATRKELDSTDRAEIARWIDSLDLM